MLTELKLRKLKASGHIGRVPDDKGLFLLMRKTGIHSWQYRYISPETMKERIYTLGNYPKITLPQARAEHRLLYHDVKSGNCPQGQKLKLRNTKPKESVLFKDIAEDWLAMNKRKVSQVTWEKDWSRLERYFFPTFANKKIEDIRPDEILKHITKIVDSIGRETGSRTLNVVKRVYDYAKVTGKVMYNNAEGLVKYINPPEIKNRKAFEKPEELGKYIYTVENDKSKHDLVGCALRLMPHIFCRHGEMLGMKWSEINWKKKEWVYEVGKTQKSGIKKQIVFLSEPVIKILEDIKKITGNEENVFHSIGKHKQLSQRATGYRLRELGFDIHFHGFRANARTFGEEVLKADEKVLEMCIAHVIPDSNKGAYSRSERLPDRKDFYNKWSDYLLQLKKEHQKKSIKRVK